MSNWLALWISLWCWWLPVLQSSNKSEKSVDEYDDAKENEEKKEEKDINKLGELMSKSNKCTLNEDRAMGDNLKNNKEKGTTITSNIYCTIQHGNFQLWVERFSRHDLDKFVEKVILPFDATFYSHSHSRSLCQHLDDMTIFPHFCRSSASLTPAVIPVTVHSAMAVSQVLFGPPRLLAYSTKPFCWS